MHLQENNVSSLDIALMHHLQIAGSNWKELVSKVQLSKLQSGLAADWKQNCTSFRLLLFVFYAEAASSTAVMLITNSVKYKLNVVLPSTAVSFNWIV